MLKGLLVVFPVATFGLGSWQLYRLRWKLDLNNYREQRTKMDPIEPATFNEELIKELDFRPIQLKGTFLHDYEQLLSPRFCEVAKGRREAGYHIITPFKRDNGEVILVNRGWVPLNMKDPAARKEGQITKEVTIRGIVNTNHWKPSYFTPDNDPQNSTWYWIDVPRMSQLLGTKPVVVDVQSEIPKISLPRGAQTQVHLRNEHLNYAVTWYSLSFFFTLMATYVLKKPTRPSFSNTTTRQPRR
uniref:SURF1-like protein n=1 Tax=Arcella intermedia TaxID=1963864 RepID=A0A6B2LFT4_9EUKA|eukprot:TRINITY_DN2500_c0_g1_i2.p1 TRINITY_DN2500_c0_g1~~TRINITY_DN2500_c0_g1_i2.p1  ORF type:complete len:243 (-),score=58.61 TRINITY_DN2500_c0_g1_i2:30-758(-)